MRFSVLVLPLLLACEQAVPAPPAAVPPPPAPSAPAPSADPQPAPPAPRTDADDAGGWLEAARYGLRIEGVKRCGTAPRPTSGKMWVGAEARVRTKEDELFVTARDFSLERGGVILEPRHIDRPLLPGCLPLLQPSELRARQSARGFVLFEVPVTWTSAREPLVLAYRPTRWGGAQRIESRIAPCLDACADTPSASRASNRSLATIRRR